MGKIDLRIRRTRRLLGEALVSLILEKGYESVTIKAITDRAEVAYMTFFRHYNSIDDLLMEVLEGGLAALRSQIKSLAQQAAASADEAEGKLIFEHVRQNADFFRILLESRGAARIRKRVRDTIASIFLETCRPLKESGSFIPAEVAASHIASSLLGLIELWLEGNMPYSPAHMGRIYSRLITGATLITLANPGR
ncbi:MAG: TetR/AcrR family transcriptional regulator [Spirochaetota bacterium]